MTGISEILVLVLLICCILILPRIFKPQSAGLKQGKSVLPKSVSAKMRAGIVLSILLPVVAALVMKPWQGNLIAYLAFGVLPVALCWALFWILDGRQG